MTSIMDDIDTPARNTSRNTATTILWTDRQDQGTCVTGDIDTAADSAVYYANIHSTDATWLLDQMCLDRFIYR